MFALYKVLYTLLSDKAREKNSKLIVIGVTNKWENNDDEKVYFNTMTSIIQTCSYFMNCLNKVQLM